jgi:hypothetical protein
MGRAAAQFIINRLNRTEDFRELISFEPDLMIRESTSLAMQDTSYRHSKAESRVGASKRRSSLK